MLNTTKKILATTAVAMGVTGFAQLAAAQDSVNVAFFLEWATPNQIAKVEKAYDEAMGVDVNWTNFGSGVEMAEAMVAGDIDISYSQGLAPFVNAAKQGKPIKMIGVAVVYEANDCYVRNDLGIDSSNASELEGKTVAVPVNTMADFSFRKQMEALDVELDTLKIVDQLPADGAASLVDRAVDMVCLYGAASAKIAGEVGAPIMSTQEKEDAKIGSFDVVSVTESFAKENPELVRTFMQVTDEANANWRGTDEQINKVAKDAGMDFDTTKDQITSFYFPSAKEQARDYFGENGEAAIAAESLGLVFSGENASYDGSLSEVIDGSYLK